MADVSRFVLSAAGDEVFSALASSHLGRRWSPAEVHDHIAANYGIEVVEGIHRFTRTEAAEGYRTDGPIAAARLLFEAHVVRECDGSSLEWITGQPKMSTPWVAFVFALSMGNGAQFPQPTGQFDLMVNDSLVATFTSVKRSSRWRNRSESTLLYDVCRVETGAFGTGFTLDECIKDESTFVDGTAVLLIPRAALPARRPPVIKLLGRGRSPSRRWVRVGRGEELALADPIVPAIRSLLEEPRQPELFGKTMVFGDIHNHSGESQLLHELPEGVGAEHGCGADSRESLFRYAKDVAGLDFFCLSEHDWQMSDGDWEQLNALTEQWNTSDGSFVTLHGFEWTSGAFGHRNVYFRDLPAPVFYSADVRSEQNVIDDGLPTPNDLWAYLDQQNMPAITIPHHMSARFFPLSVEAYFSASYDRAAEIYSSWGDSLEPDQVVTTYAQRVPELAYIEAVKHGFKTGFIASSDSHDGHPGNAQGTALRRQLYHFLGSGLGGVLVDQPTRTEIFDGLHARRSCAVTTSGLAVATEMEGNLMGSVLSAARLAQRPKLHINVQSFSPLSEIVIYKNGLIDARIPVSGRDVDVEWQDGQFARDESANYFVKAIRADQEMGWSSPIWIEQ